MLSEFPEARVSRLSRLLPNRCLLCRQPTHRQLDICKACECALAPTANACRICAEPLAAGERLGEASTPRSFTEGRPTLLVSSQQEHLAGEASVRSQDPLNALGDDGVCGRCVVTPPPWCRTLAPFAYAPPLTRIIEGLKSGNGLRQARVLGSLLAEAAGAEYPAGTMPHAVVPMPLTRWRKRRRGFNQADLLARATARILGLPVLARHLARIRNAPPQRTLSRSARLRNVRGAFRSRRPLSYRSVALIDDVTTTGATVRAASLALQAGGVEEVHVWVAAKSR